MRGNRVTKFDNSGLDAFTSPNLLPLATMEIDIKGLGGEKALQRSCHTVDDDAIFRGTGQIGKFSVQTNLCRNIGHIKITPSIRVEVVSAQLSANHL